MESIEKDFHYKIINKLKGTNKGYDINNYNENKIKHISFYLQKIKNVI